MNVLKVMAIVVSTWYDGPHYASFEVAGAARCEEVGKEWMIKYPARRPKYTCFWTGKYINGGGEYIRRNLK